jgi:hypothetical protein
VAYGAATLLGWAMKRNCGRAVNAKDEEWCTRIRVRRQGTPMAWLVESRVHEMHPGALSQGVCRKRTHRQSSRHLTPWFP